MIARLRLLPHNVVVLLHDCLLGVCSLWMALYLRLGSRLFAPHELYYLKCAVIFGAVLLIALLYARSYRRVWRYTSLNDLLALTRTATVAMIIFYVGAFLVNRLEFMPRSVPFIHWMCLMLCLTSPRVMVRLLQDRRLFHRLLGKQGKRVPVLLIGATAQAEIFIRESERSVDFPYHVVGLVDASPQHRGREIHHVRIYGTLDEVDYIIEKMQRKGRAPQRLLLADPRIDREQLDPLMKAAEKYNLTLARLPSQTELQAGGQVHHVHPVAVEDILGRQQVALDREAMRALIAGKRVLITGAGGSIGSEMVRQIVGYGPTQILLYELSEYLLYEIDREVGQLNGQLPRHAVIGDVRDKDQLHRVFAAFKPELVFHAAAVKHVPLSEANPEQAILTNIQGSKYVADACVAHHVTAMVQISTDKAVNPTNVMGASKRAAEIYTQMLAQEGTATRFITVRFGNVLNSAGSVVPLFQKQLAAGGPITVTHRDMERYFMTIAEAVQLVLQAAALGMNGDRQAPIFVLDMGKPVRIEELACQMIRLAGMRPYQDIEIVFTGLRPGEKMYEELFYDAENLAPTEHQSIRLAEARAIDRVAILKALSDVLAAAREGDVGRLRPLLKQVVAEYQLPV